MTLCNTKAIEFTRCKSRKIHQNVYGGVITSDAGLSGYPVHCRFFKVSYKRESIASKSIIVFIGCRYQMKIPLRKLPGQ
jgi:hypothetical protein